MIRRVQYGFNWWDTKRRWTFDARSRRAPAEFDENEARRRHAAKLQYALLIDLDDGSRVVALICEGHEVVFVNFLDDQDRYIMTYTFARREGHADLFLADIWRGWYKGDERRVDDGYVVRYFPDGLVRRIPAENGGPQSSREWHEPLDPGVHFEPMPAFGQWDSIIRRDRTKPVPAG